MDSPEQIKSRKSYRKFLSQVRALENTRAVGVPCCIEGLPLKVIDLCGNLKELVPGFLIYPKVSLKQHDMIELCWEKDQKRLTVDVWGDVADFDWQYWDEEKGSTEGGENEEEPSVLVHRVSEFCLGIKEKELDVPRDQEQPVEDDGSFKGDIKSYKEVGQYALDLLKRIDDKTKSCS